MSVNVVGGVIFWIVFPVTVIYNPEILNVDAPGSGLKEID
jgi:hypothetical protein